MVKEVAILKVWKLQKEQLPPQQQSTYFKTEHHEASEMRFKGQRDGKYSVLETWRDGYLENRTFGL
jgi:hypothetical protein